MKTLCRLLLGSFVLTFSAAYGAEELPTARPDQVGVSQDKLNLATQVVQKMIDKKQIAGAVTVVMRDGKVVQMQAQGKMDVDKNREMKSDAIFRIYSMSKPITTVAAMMLFEEGRFQLDDPVSKYLPEFKKLRVHSGEGDETVEAKREVTIRDLMRHSSGLTYGVFGDTPVDRLYRQKRILDRGDTLQEFVTRLTTIPLQFQPGTRFHYGVNTDVLGRLVEVISGKTLDVVFEERIFKPLDMVDTAFYVPASKVDRFATNYGPSLGGGLRVIDDPAKSPYLKQPKFLSGGGGLCSTARDYARFCQMLLNGGELQGTRLLKQETVKDMTHNQLPPEALPMTMPLNIASDPGLGFGLGFGIHSTVSSPDSGSVAGEYFWGGAASTGFTICPKNQTVVILMTQFMPFNPLFAEAFKRAVNASVEPAAAAK